MLNHNIQGYEKNARALMKYLLENNKLYHEVKLNLANGEGTHVFAFAIIPRGDLEWIFINL